MVARDFSETTLHDALTDVSGSIDIVSFPGNNGDALIRHGARTAFTAAGITYTNLSHSPSILQKLRRTAAGRTIFNGLSIVGLATVLTDVVGPFTSRLLASSLSDDHAAVYIHGGGSLNDIWGIGIQTFRTVATQTDSPIIVGPQSYQFTQTDPCDLFSLTNAPVHLFCREQYSYDHLTRFSLPENVHLYTCHDTSFFIDPAHEFDVSVEDRHVLHSFRSDRESGGQPPDLPVDNTTVVQDVSDQNKYSFEDYLQTIGHSTEIHTNRLHVAILGALYGKPVRFYEGAYHKFRGVYEYSLASSSSVEFVPNQAFQGER